MVSERTWRAIRLIGVVFVSCYGVVLAVGSPAGFPEQLRSGRFMPYLADKPLQEDSFYMLTVAWNAGKGDGFSYNDRQPTAGVQPLNTLLDAVLARAIRLAGGTQWTFARAALCLGVLNLLVFSVLAAGIARRLSPRDGTIVAGNAGAIAVAITLVNFALFRQFTNGLETGLYTILAGCCVWLSLRPPDDRRLTSGSVLLGATAGLAVLARIDFLVVFAAYLLAAWALRTLRFRDAVLAGIIACVVASPWFMFVHGLTGRWVPSSGLAQAGSTSVLGLVGRTWLMALAAVQEVSPWIHLEAARIAISARLTPWGAFGVLTVVAVALAGLAAAVARPAVRHIEPRTQRTLAAWSIAWAALFTVYPIFFYATYFYPRYATPLVGIGLPLLAVGMSIRNHTMIARAAIILMPAMFVATAYLTLHNGSLGNVNLLTAAYVSRSLPAGERVGAFQSGVVGYFNENVVNLDGKINADALAAIGAGTLPAYVDAQRIRYLTDWPAIIAMTLPAAYLEREWTPCPTPTGEPQIVCLTRK